MKVRIILLLFSMFLSACDKTDIIREEADNELIGNWSMISITHENYASENFNSGDIIWTFKSNTTVIVTLNVEPNLFPIIDTNGNYSYDYIDNIFRLYLSEEELSFEVSIEANQMTFSRTTEEGTWKYQFEKL